MKIVLFDDQFKTAANVSVYLSNSLINKGLLLEQQTTKHIFVSTHVIQKYENMPENFQFIDHTFDLTALMDIIQTGNDNLFLVINDELGTFLTKIVYDTDNAFWAAFDICISDCQMTGVQGLSIVKEMAKSCCKILYSGDPEIKGKMSKRYANAFNAEDVNTRGYDGYIVKASEPSPNFYGEMASFIKERYENRTQLLSQVIDRLLSRDGSPGRKLTHCNCNKVKDTSNYVGDLFGPERIFENFVKEYNETSIKLPDYVKVLFNGAIKELNDLNLNEESAVVNIENIKAIMGAAEDLKYHNSLKTKFRMYVSKICDDLSPNKFAFNASLLNDRENYFIVEHNLFDCFLNEIKDGNDVGKCGLEINLIHQLGKFIIFSWEKNGTLLSQKDKIIDSDRGGIRQGLVELSKWFTIIIKSKDGELMLRNGNPIIYCNLFDEIKSNWKDGQLIALHQD